MESLIDLDSSSSSEDDMSYLKPPSLSLQRQRNPVPILDIVCTSYTGKPSSTNNIKKTEKEKDVDEDEDKKDVYEGEDDVDKKDVKEDGKGVYEGEDDKYIEENEKDVDKKKNDEKEVKELTGEENEVTASDESNEFVSFYSSESENSDNEFEDIVIEEESWNLTESKDVVMKKDVACQTIVTGDIISLNLYHGEMTGGNMYGIIKLQEICKQLDIMQGVF